MIEPIVIGEHGETMEEHRNWVGWRPNFSDDSSKIHGHAPVHSECAGWVDVCIISHTHNALVCRSCKFRIPVPKTVVTFGDLREFFAKLQPINVI